MMITYMTLLIYGPAAGSSRTQICWKRGRACVLRRGLLPRCAHLLTCIICSLAARASCCACIALDLTII